MSPVLPTIYLNNSHHISPTVFLTLANTVDSGQKGSDTVFLVVLLVSVVGSVFLVFAFVALCYRYVVVLNQCVFSYYYIKIRLDDLRCACIETSKCLTCEWDWKILIALNQIIIINNIIIILLILIINYCFHTWLYGNIHVIRYFYLLTNRQSEFGSLSYKSRSFNYKCKRSFRCVLYIYSDLRTLSCRHFRFNKFMFVLFL